jgi:hypothetical protein
MSGVDPIVNTAAKTPAFGDEFPPFLVDKDKAFNISTSGPSRS